MKDSGLPEQIGKKSVKHSASAPAAFRRYQRVTFLALLFAVSGAFAFIALMLPFSVLSFQGPLKTGDVASQDIRAPKNLTYTSRFLTEEAQQQAVSAVMPVYSSTDTDVARRQMERLRVTFSYISSVRADAYASSEQRLADLAALEDLHLDQETSRQLLDLSNSRWQTVQQEGIVVLEQVMRSTIRPNDLEAVRTSTPYLVSLSLPEELASLVVLMVDAFITPNSLYDETATQYAVQQARLSVEPVSRTFVAGETIVQRGRLITPLDIEALAEYGLAQPQVRWSDYAGAAALVLVSMIFLFVYLRRNPGPFGNPRSQLVLTGLFLVFLFGVRLAIPGHTIIPYLFPLAAYGLVIAALFGAEPALVTALPLAVMATYSLPYSLQISLYYFITTAIGVYVLGRAQRFTTYFSTGLMVALAGIGLVIAHRLPDPNMDLNGIITLSGSAVIYGIASAGITLLLQFFLAQFLGMTTSLQLMELSRPDQPLLQLLLRNAPGTYQHSLQVANLGEQAAERIGADALLTRVGALYHDIGKATDSGFFIENQVPGNANPHDTLDPAISATMIIRHIVKGLELAHRYRLPRRIQNFIAEHHGTMLTHYQYTRAIKETDGNADEIDTEDYRYPGPRPQSRETALIMLADGCEAQVRAEHPQDEDALRAIIKNVVERRMTVGQLNDTDLTLRDLDAIIDSFSATLKGVYHPRLQYPGFNKQPLGQEIAIIEPSPGQDNNKAQEPATEPSASTN